MKVAKQKPIHFLIYFIPLILIEVLFRIQAGMYETPIFWIRSLFFTLFLATFLYTLNAWKQNKIVAFITIFIIFGISLYSFLQIGISHYYGYFFSVRILMKGTPDVGSYALDYLLYIKPITYLILVVGIASSILYLYLKPKSASLNLRKDKLLHVTATLFVYSVYILSVIFFDPPNLFETSIKLYLNPKYSEISINQLGTSAFLMSDVQYLVNPGRANEKDVNIDEPTIPPVEIPKEPDLLEGRNPDDHLWTDLAQREVNENIKAVDSFFLNKSKVERNDKTGIYKDMNFIYVLVEAFDLIAIDKDLTPTLYKLKNEGTFFENFYSPQFNCATAESELISMSSIYPVVGTCTMSAYYNDANPQTVFNLFKAHGYQTSSYHNWNDQFYPRTKIHPVLGSDKYLDSDTLIQKQILGWQSDLTMMEGVVSRLNQYGDDKFMAYVITSSTHLPYDVKSTLGSRYVNEVLKVYPDAPLEIRTYLSKAIELDKAMEYLLKNLEDMDNTVIAMFADHRPLKMKGEYLNTYSSINRLENHELDHTPFIIYTPNQTPETNKTPASTIDMLPTLANLFDLNHDTRLFMGTDIYGDAENLVIFQNGSWYDSVGYYNASKASFVPYDLEVTHSVETIQRINQTVKTKLSISSIIYTESYFDLRPFLKENTLNAKN